MNKHIKMEEKPRKDPNEQEKEVKKVLFDRKKEAK